VVKLPPRADYPATGPLYTLAETGKDFAAFITKSLKITLVGEIHIIDAFNDTRVQRWGCLVVGGCDKDGPSWEFRRFDASLSHFPNR
jgi:hypothetical protein